MSREELVHECQAIQKRHNLERWLNMLIGTLLLVGGFASVYFPSLQSLLPDDPAIVAGPIGGVIVISVLRDWSGSRSMKALEEAKSQLVEQPLD